jgi:hypothetical protein
VVIGAGLIPAVLAVAGLPLLRRALWEESREEEKRA